MRVVLILIALAGVILIVQWSAYEAGGHTKCESFLGGKKTGPQADGTFCYYGVPTIARRAKP